MSKLIAFAKKYRTLLVGLILIFLLVASIALSVVWPGAGWEYLVAFIASAFAAAPMIVAVRIFAQKWIPKRFHVLFKTLSYSAIVVGLFYVMIKVVSGFDPWYVFILFIQCHLVLEVLQPIREMNPLTQDPGEKSLPAG